MESASLTVAHSELPYKSKITKDLQVISGDNSEKLQTLRSKNIPLIGTHSEVFHSDEVLATTMLLYTKEYANGAIVRTRNDQVLDTLDIVLDVGSVFDPEKKRFDHHQRSFDTYWNEDYQNKGIKLSTAGLIYKFYGKEVLANIL